MQEELAEIINYLEIIWGLIRASEIDGTPGPGGTRETAAEPWPLSVMTTRSSIRG